MTNGEAVVTAGAKGRRAGEPRNNGSGVQFARLGYRARLYRLARNATPEEAREEADTRAHTDVHMNACEEQNLRNGKERLWKRKKPGPRRVKPTTGEGEGGIRGALGLIAVYSDVPDHTPARPSAAIPLLVRVKYRCQKGPNSISRVPRVARVPACSIDSPGSIVIRDPADRRISRGKDGRGSGDLGDPLNVDLDRDYERSSKAQSEAAFFRTLFASAGYRGGFRDVPVQVHSNESDSCQFERSVRQIKGQSKGI